MPPSNLRDTSVPKIGQNQLADVIVAERMRSEESGLGFFDSLHAATSKRLGLSLLSGEGVYGRLGLPVIDLDKL